MVDRTVEFCGPWSSHECRYQVQETSKIKALTPGSCGIRNISDVTLVALQS